MPRMTEDQIRLSNKALPHKPDLTPLELRPVYDPLRSRAFRNVLERIDPDRRVISMGRK